MIESIDEKVCADKTNRHILQEKMVLTVFELHRYTEGLLSKLISRFPTTVGLRNFIYLHLKKDH